MLLDTECLNKNKINFLDNTYHTYNSSYQIHYHFSTDNYFVNKIKARNKNYL